MAKIYFKRIVEGKMMLEDVPERWRDEVQELLEEYYTSIEQEDADDAEEAEQEGTEE